MNIVTLNYLHHILTYRFDRKVRSNNNFSEYFKIVLLKSHFLTRIFIKIFLILFIFFCYALNLKPFYDLSLKNAEEFLIKISKLPFMKIFLRIIKLYSYIYYFDKNDEKYL